MLKNDAREHLFALKRAKESVTIPVFASLNAVTDESWTEYAKEIEKTGVDGIELNLYTVPEKSDTGFNNIEKNNSK